MHERVVGGGRGAINGHRDTLGEAGVAEPFSRWPRPDHESRQLERSSRGMETGLESTLFLKMIGPAARGQLDPEVHGLTGTAHGVRRHDRLFQHNGFRGRPTLAGIFGRHVAELRLGSRSTACLRRQWMIEKTLPVATQEARVGGISTCSEDGRVRSVHGKSSTDIVFCKRGKISPFRGRSSDPARPLQNRGENRRCQRYCLPDQACRGRSTRPAKARQWVPLPHMQRDKTDGSVETLHRMGPERHGIAAG